MPDLLIELFSEEIPARMQGMARDALRKAVTDGLVEAGLTYRCRRLFDAAPPGADRAGAGCGVEAGRARNARGRGPTRRMRRWRGSCARPA